MKRVLTALLCACASTSILADQLIIEPEMGRKPVVQLIDQAKHTIDLVMYGFTDQTLLDAIIRKHAQGKSVKVILEDAPYKTETENNKTIKQLAYHDIAWHGKIPPFKLIHQKTLLIDGRTALVMTFNFTHSAFKNDRNFGLIMDDPKRVREIEKVFSADWQHQPIDAAGDDLIWSPDNSRAKLITHINKARSHLNIYAQSMSDYKLVGALANAARRGVTIRLLTSKLPREKQRQYLTRAGVVIQQSKSRYIHAKVFIIDNEEAILGSINMTRASLDDNRELSVITHDPHVIQSLKKTFDHDWQSSATTNESILDAATTKKVLRESIKMLKRYLSV